MEWKVDGERGNYILRYYLPCEPTYSADVTERRAEELIKYCLDTDISTVMLYVDLDPNWYYMPDDTKHTEYYVPIIEKLAVRLRENGISYQLNYQNLFGSWDGGADLRQVNGWENYVDEKGVESCGCACSIGEKFRKIGGNKLKMWAKTKPDAIWIDDDIRFHHHRSSIYEYWQGKTHKERFDFGCFCDRHVELFNKKNSLALTRDEIVSGILEGNELRKKWLDFSGECASELTSWIEKTVHEVSPDTRVAIMTSKPDVHAVEGRDWNGFLGNLSKPHRPLIRPTFGPYKESTPTFFVRSYTMVEQLKANIEAQYGHDTDFCPEIENTRFTRWAKCINATGYQIMMSAFLGCKSVTLSIFNLDGCVLEEEPEFARLLKEKRPFIDRLAKENLWDKRGTGVGLITAPDRIPFTSHKVSQIESLAFGRLWDETLLIAGIPCTYVTPDRLDGVSCFALDTYTARLLKDDEILKILSKGVLLNAGAVDILDKRGFGKYLGVKVRGKVPCIAGAEKYNTLCHRDGSYAKEPSRMEGGKWSELVLDGAVALSEAVTPYGTCFPGFTEYENELGGKVFAYAADSSIGDGFYSNFRIRLLKDICKKMSGDSIIEVNNQSYGIVAVKSDVKSDTVFVSNYTADPYGDIEIVTPYNVESAVIIDSSGNEHTPIIRKNTVVYKNSDINMYDAFVCKINY